MSDRAPRIDTFFSYVGHQLARFPSYLSHCNGTFWPSTSSTLLGTSFAHFYLPYHSLFFSQISYHALLSPLVASTPAHGVTEGKNRLEKKPTARSMPPNGCSLVSHSVGIREAVQLPVPAIPLTRRYPCHAIV
jgi:hypothetical protein